MNDARGRFVSSPVREYSRVCASFVTFCKFTNRARGYLKGWLWTFYATPEGRKTPAAKINMDALVSSRRERLEFFFFSYSFFFLYLFSLITHSSPPLITTTPSRISLTGNRGFTRTEVRLSRVQNETTGTSRASGNTPHYLLNQVDFISPARVNVKLLASLVSFPPSNRSMHPNLLGAILRALSKPFYTNFGPILFFKTFSHIFFSHVFPNPAFCKIPQESRSLLEKTCEKKIENFEK